MGFFAEELKAEYLGHQLAATVSISANVKELAAKLYIDGQVVDSSQSAPKGVGFLKGKISAEGKDHIVEVFTVGWFNKHLVIKVDGQELARSG